MNTYCARSLVLFLVAALTTDRLGRDLAMCNM